MHTIQLHIYNFLESLGSKPYKIPVKLLAKFSEEAAQALRSQFEREPRKFSLSMGNIGKPTCQLQFAQAGTKSEYRISIRNLYGNLCEALVIFLLHASGITVLSEQERISLEIEGRKVNGVLDVILDLGDGPTVWDIKSASEWSFKNKYTNITFEEFVRDDYFGYVSQLMLYAKAKNIRPGGWIVFDKSSGEIGVITVPPEVYQEYILSSENEAKKKIRKLKASGPLEIEREFEALPEIFNKKDTGRKVLGTVCSFCDYKFHCWPGLTLKAQEDSKSKTPKLLYYVDTSNAD